MCRAGRDEAAVVRGGAVLLVALLTFLFLLALALVVLVLVSVVGTKREKRKKKTSIHVHMRKSNWPLQKARPVHLSKPGCCRRERPPTAQTAFGPGQGVYGRVL